MFTFKDRAIFSATNSVRTSPVNIKTPVDKAKDRAFFFSRLRKNLYVNERKTFSFKDIKPLKRRGSVNTQS
jgi:hypothetical protein